MHITNVHADSMTQLNTNDSNIRKKLTKDNVEVKSSTVQMAVKF